MVNETSSILAVYNTHQAAEEGVRKLHKSGFDVRTLSVVGRDDHTEEHVVGYYKAGNRIKYWGELGRFWEHIFGLLPGWAFFWVPEIGPLLVGGPLVERIVERLQSAAMMGGLSVLGAGLHSLGIPKDSVLRYETAVKAGKYLLVVYGPAEEVAAAKAMLKATDYAELGMYRPDQNFSLLDFHWPHLERPPSEGDEERSGGTQKEELGRERH